MGQASATTKVTTKVTITITSKSAKQVSKTKQSKATKMASMTGKDSATLPKRSVCVIGCGPGGMFFCHNINKIIQEQRASKEGEQKSDQGSAEPFLDCEYDVQCFEAASSHGGVWRKASNNKTTADNADTAPADTKVAMYDNLWTNGPSLAMEMYDYTFDEHLNGGGNESESKDANEQITVYLKRQTVLDYITARVTRKCPDFFERFVQFNTKVLSVEWKEDLDKFEVTTENMELSDKKTQLFDYCVWAGGNNGKQNIPKQPLQRIKEGGFTGTIFHSADSACLEQDLKGKNVVLVGAAYSAEDLGNQLVKLGANHVHILSRSSEPDILDNTCWPGNRVTIHVGAQLKNTNENTIFLERVRWEWPGEYLLDEEAEELPPIQNVDTIIFCTGYGAGVSMLHPSLRPGLHRGDGKSKFTKLVVPDDWKMEMDPLRKFGIDAKAEECVYFYDYLPDFYHGVKITNRKMMFMDQITYNPMFDADVLGWFFASLVTGRVVLTETNEELEQFNHKMALEMLQSKHNREFMDKNYCDAMDQAWKEIDEEELDKSIEECAHLDDMVFTKVLADAMKISKYPVSFGSLQELNERAMEIVALLQLGSAHRYKTFDGANESADPKDWRTFRDYEDAEKFKSIHTHAPARKLSKPWLLHD